MNFLPHIALSYLRAGLSLVPNLQDAKRPAISWTEFQKRLPTEDEIREWFPRYRVGIVCGEVSGNGELLDFDDKGSRYAEWLSRVEEMQPELTARLLVERSPSGGYHVFYRCREVKIPGNTKLAQFAIEVASSIKEYEHNGKTVQVKQYADGKFYAVFEAIETRGEGGQFVCAPNPGYQVLQGDYESVPEFTAAEREILISAARSLNEWYPPEAPEKPKSNNQLLNAHDGESPADEFNRTHTFKELLEKHGWKHVATKGENTLWRRPGKERGEWSASVLRDECLYVFSTNAAPFDDKKGYSKFGAYAVLEHAGDLSRAAATILKARPPKTDYGTYHKQAADVPPADPTPATFKTIRECLENPELRRKVRRIPTGYPDLDKILNGGAMPGGLYVLAGPTGGGKSTLVDNCIRRMALNGLKALLLSLEMPEVQVTRCLLAASAHVRLHSIENLDFDDDECQALRAARAVLDDIPLCIDDSTARLDAVCSAIKGAGAQGFKVVAIDQMSWIHADGSTPFERAAAISRRLKATAKESGVVLILLCQVNRDGCRKPDGPDLYDLRDSGTIEQDADGVLMIRKVERLFNGHASEMLVAMLKHRHGPQGDNITAKFSWFMDQARIETYVPQGVQA